MTKWGLVLTFIFIIILSLLHYGKKLEEKIREINDIWKITSKKLPLNRPIQLFFYFPKIINNIIMQSHNYKHLSNSSLEIFKSFLIILFSKPLFICSPGWLGISVVLPSGCLKNIWLPSCLMNLKPILSRILINSFADKKGSLAILDFYLLYSKEFFINFGFFAF